MTSRLVMPAAPRAVLAAAVALLSIMLVALAWPGAAHAATPGIQYSADGVSWSDVAPLASAGPVVLAPGQESTTTLQLRNTSNHVASVGFFLGSYTVAPGTGAYFRADRDGVKGQAMGVAGGTASPNALLRWVSLSPNQTATVSLVVGVPADAKAAGTVTANWVAGTAVCTPGLGSSGLSLNCLVTGQLSTLLNSGSAGR